MTVRRLSPRFAALTPYMAQWLLARLAEGKPVTRASVRHQAAYLRSLPHPDAAQFADQLEGGWLQIEAAAMDHGERMRSRSGPVVSVGGNAEGASTEMGGGSGVSGEMTTQEAAEMLRMTPRRVSQLLTAGALKGRKVGRSWLVDRESVLTLRDVRSAS